MPVENLPVVFKTADEVALRVHDGVLEVEHAGRRESEFLLTLERVLNRVDVILEIVARGLVHVFEGWFDLLELSVVAREDWDWLFMVDVDLEATICDFSHGEGDLPFGLGDDPVQESLGQLQDCNHTQGHKSG